MRATYLGLILLFGVVHSRDISVRSNCHGSHCTDLVDTALENLNLHYDVHLCHVIDSVDCTTHVTQGDEVLCGSDGVTYDNHCYYVQEMCKEYLNSHHQNPSITIASHGPCIVKATTEAPATKAPVRTTVQSAGTTTTTMPPDTTTTMMSTTTTSANLATIIANVFCQQSSSVDCNSGFNIVCGSDGQYYPNDCELSKAKCLDPTLGMVPTDQCNP